MERDAYALLELTPDQFWELTPKEYEFMVEGYKYRKRERARDLQWLLYPQYRKQTPKLSDLTGFEDDKVTEKPIEQSKQDYEELKSLLMW